MKRRMGRARGLTGVDEDDMDRLKTSLDREWEEYRAGALVLREADEGRLREARRHFMAGAATILEIFADLDADGEGHGMALQYAVTHRLREDVCRFAGAVLRGKA